MDIYAHLSTKPHNKHFLNRYFNFISAKSKHQSRKMENYFEKHHILPASVFPEFKNLKKFTWNQVMLTEREHQIAHKMLTKVFTDLRYRHKMLCASILMGNKSDSDKVEFFQGESFAAGRRKMSIRKKAKNFTEKEKAQYEALPKIIKNTWKLLSDEEKKLKFEPGLNVMNSQDTCIYCGFTTNRGNIGRYHNEKCKHKPIN